MIVKLEEIFKECEVDVPGEVLGLERREVLHQTVRTYHMQTRRTPQILNAVGERPNKLVTS